MLVLYSLQTLLPLISRSPEQLPVALAAVSQALPCGCWQVPGSAPVRHSETQTESRQILIRQTDV